MKKEKVIKVQMETDLQYLKCIRKAIIQILAIESERRREECGV